MVYFVIGLFVGSMAGVFCMALVSMARDEDDKQQTKREKG